MKCSWQLTQRGCRCAQAQEVSQQQSDAIAEHAPPVQPLMQQPAQRGADAEASMDDELGMSFGQPDAAADREQPRLFKRPADSEPAAPQSGAEDRLDSKCTRWGSSRLTLLCHLVT